MNHKVILAAVNSKPCDFPIQANPFSEQFKIEKAKENIENNLDKLCLFLHEAGKMGVDMVCTHEDIKREGIYSQFLDDPGILSALVEEVPGPSTERIGEITRQYGMYAIVNYFEKESDKFYNTTVLIDSYGKVSGKYRKVHLPVSERWLLTPGNDFPVFETYFGKIGAAVCYDIIFPETIRILSLKGADIVFHPTLGWGFGEDDIGEALIRTRAHENSVYIVAAKNCIETGSGRSCIVQNNGHISAESKVGEEAVITCEIQLDSDRMQDENCFSSFLSGVNSLRGRRILERRTDAYSNLLEPYPDIKERYSNVELADTPEKISMVYNQLKEYYKVNLGEKNTAARPLFW